MPIGALPSPMRKRIDYNLHATYPLTPLMTYEVYKVPSCLKECMRSKNRVCDAFQAPACAQEASANNMFKTGHPRSPEARIQPRFGTLQIKLKLAHNVGRDMPNSQSESFGGTPSRLTYRGQQRSRGSN